MNKVNTHINTRTKKKINRTNLVRRILQIVSFLIVPGLFISVFSSIKAVYMAAISGAFSFGDMLPQILILLAVLPITAIFGRFFCGFLCSFGAIGDFLWFVSKKLGIKKLNISESSDKALKLFKYVLLLFLIIFVWTLGIITIDSNSNPWNIFGMYTSISSWSNLAGFATLGGLLLIIIFAGSLLIERFFCRYLCPLGAVYAIISKIRIFKIKKPAAECKSCKICTNSCSMGINMYKHDMINSGECIDCFQCLPTCPKQNTQAVVSGRAAAPLATGVMMSAAITGLYFAGNASASSVSDDDIAVERAAIVTQLAETIATSGYADGTYSGSASGYRGTTEVEVTIENGFISDITIVSTDDDMEFFEKAEKSVVTDIISEQSVDVDVVTGATYSSYAIINAVADAIGDDYSYDLDNIIESAIQEAEEDTISSSESLAISSVTSSEDIADLADGTYAGEGTGFRGTTTVNVVVEDGKIQSIEIVSYQDDEKYMQRAISSVTSSIISEQAVDVDAVSGATFSSNGIMEAVADALGMEYTNMNSTLESGHGHGGGPGH